MKKTACLLSAALLGLFGALHNAAAHGDDHDHQPRHGGIVSEVRDVDYELVARPDVIQLHLRDHGQPVDVSQASARLTLLSGAEKREIELKPAGPLLEARGDFRIAGARAVAVVTRPGKPPATVRFALH